MASQVNEISHSSGENTYEPVNNQSNLRDYSRNN